MINSAWGGFCAVARPIQWSSKDTPQTVRDIKAYNQLGFIHCGWPL